MQKKTEVKKEEIPGRGLVDLVFSWSLKDVLNEDLYKYQMRMIPQSFSSTKEYMASFCDPLAEETHADLLSGMSTLSQAPTREIIFVKQFVKSETPKDLFYHVTLESVRKFKDRGGRYKPVARDLIAITDVRPKCIADLVSPNRSYLVAFVLSVRQESCMTILSSKPILIKKDKNKKRETLYAVPLMNMNTNIRIWMALNSKLEGGNLNIIQNVLQYSSVNSTNCTACLLEKNCSAAFADVRYRICSSDLNDSQKDAVLSCLVTRECHHQSTVKLIWGPPGTGKTKTVGFMLCSLLRMKCRTLTCAPTNTALLEVTQRLLKNVTGSLEYDTYGLGDVVLFGNSERMKIFDCPDLLDVFLDNRVKILYECLVSSSGWKGSLLSMMCLLEDPKRQYELYLNERSMTDNKEGTLSFEEFIQRRFDCILKRLNYCIVNLYTHLPTSFISLEVVKNMNLALDFLRSLETLLCTVTVADKGLKQVSGENEQSRLGNLMKSSFVRKDCLRILRSLPQKFPVPDFRCEDEIKKFCLENSCLFFCTVSSSAKLHEVMVKWEVLVIDEAAQLKECESTIPLQLPGLHHAILIGDEQQLPAMVKSKVSEKAEFGRSLFQRLVLLGKKKELLNVQHRMHPSISLFPNRVFYENQILDGPNVKEGRHEKRFLQGNMFGSYSFINVAHGKEEFDNSHSLKNMVEVAVASEIVASLFKESVCTKKKVKVGIISPYKAQVYAIGEKVKNYSVDSNDDFSISIRSVDGFQGGEEDVIIVSTVRCNMNGVVGFLKNHQRANVALTRARHCLWILGNEATLIKRCTIWKDLVIDAKKRGCFYNADEDKSLAQAITVALVEHNQIHILLNMDSFLFKKARWKVSFSNDFLKSMLKVENAETCKEVLTLLENLANGWRHEMKKLFYHNGTSSQLLEQYKVNGFLNLVWTVDILEENSYYIQILKVWDILPLSEMPRLANRLDVLFENYTVDKMNRCKHKSLNRSLVVPMRWPIGSNSCTEADLVQSLSEPLASLSLRDDLESSSTTFR
ncbi:helicase SEN1-like [Castanea sativa]|uniref:helicase SEN1-like n=1 Tax=Castanea sativa TaxID=21020 RepID=UPI003F653833